MKKITFSKLGTVLCDDFREMSYNDFYRKMEICIINNPKNYNVKYNQEEKAYEITYNSVKYMVYYRDSILTNDCDNKDVVDFIKELERITTNEEKRNIFKEENNAKKVIDKLRKFSEENYSSANSEIKSILKWDKYSKTRIFEDTWDAYRKINFAEAEDMGGIGLHVITIIMFFSLAFIVVWGTFLNFMYAFDPINWDFVGKLLIGITIPTVLDSIAYAAVNKVLERKGFSKKYVGPIASIIYSFAIPYFFCKCVIGRVSEKINAYSKIISIWWSKHKDRVIKKNEMGKVARLNKKVEKKLNRSRNEVTKEKLLVLSKEMKELKDKILMIADKKDRERCSNKLLKIMSYYINASNKADEENKIEIKKEVIEQSNALKEEVNKLLRIESRLSNFNEEYQDMSNEVDYQKRIAAR